MKKILIVDNDAATLAHISNAFKEYSEFEIYTAKSAKQAVGFIGSLGINLVLTELHLPEIDGFQLLIYLKRKYPEIQSMAMGGLNSDDAKNKLARLNVKKWIKKPIDLEILAEAFFDALNIVAAGRIHGISIASFLQLVDLEKKSCTLTVRAKKKTGFIYCLNGEVIAAETGGLKGKKALYDIIFWKNSSIEIKEDCQKIRRQIHNPLMHLLMESHHLRDEEDEDVQNSLTVPQTAGEKRQEKQIDDAVRDDITALNLKLSGIPDIEAFIIFDENDVIQSRNREFSKGEHVSPSFFFNTANQLDGVGSALKCMDISINGSSRLALLQYGYFYVAADLKPGCRASDCQAKLNT